MTSLESQKLWPSLLRVQQSIGAPTNFLWYPLYEVLHSSAWQILSKSCLNSVEAHFKVKYLNYGPTEDGILNQCFYSVWLMDLGLGEGK